MVVFGRQAAWRSVQLLSDRVIKVAWWHGAVAVALLCRAKCDIRVGGRAGPSSCLAARNVWEKTKFFDDRCTENLILRQCGECFGRLSNCLALHTLQKDFAHLGDEMFFSGESSRVHH